MRTRLSATRFIRTVCFSAFALVISLLCFRLQFNLSSATSVHLFLVALLALRFGLIEASVVSVVSAGCLDYFFTDPIYQFSMDYRDWVALITFEATALLIASLSHRVTAHARESELRQTQLVRLQELSQSILLIDRKSAVDQHLADLIRSTMQIRAVALWNAHELATCRSGESMVTETELRSIYFREINRDDPGSAISRRVLRLGTRPIGALVLDGHSLDAKSVNSVAALVAISIERAKSFDSEATALASKQSEQLRSAILDGLAHSFKSPLTAIISSSSGLLAMKTLAGTEHSLVQLIDQQASNLADLTNHLLLTAKLDTGEVNLRVKQIDLATFMKDVLKHPLQEVQGHTISLEVEPDTSFFTEADERLLRLALSQVLDNAVKYGSPETPISVGLRKDQAYFNIAVSNGGSYIPIEECNKVFERFYRSPRSTTTVSGTGIGLAVVKRIVEAHRGHASVYSDRVRGTTFTIALPRFGEAVN